MIEETNKSLKPLTFYLFNAAFFKKIRYLRKDQGLKGLGGRGFIFYTSFKKIFSIRS